MNIFGRSSKQRINSTKRHHRSRRFETLEGRLVLNGIPIADPGHAYVDANNDRMFSLDHGDVALATSLLADGFFDTDLAEGAYSTPIQGAGLVIPDSLGTLSRAGSGFTFRADGHLVLGADLTATASNGVVNLESREGDVRLEGTTVSAPKEIEIKALDDIISTGNTMLQSGNKLGMVAGDEFEIAGISVNGDKLVQLTAGRDINANDAVFRSNSGKISFEAGDDIELERSLVAAKLFVDLTSGDQLGQEIAANGATFDSTSVVTMKAGGDIELRDAKFDDTFGSPNGLRRISLTAGDDILMERAQTNAWKSVDLTAGNRARFVDAVMNDVFEVSVKATDIEADRVKIHAAKKIDMVAAEDLDARDALMESMIHIRLRANGQGSNDGIRLNRSTIHSAYIELIAGGDIIADSANILACDHRGTIVMDAGSDIFLRNANVQGRHRINIAADDTIFVNAATIVVGHPGQLTLDGTLLGTPDFVGVGTVDCNI